MSRCFLCVQRGQQGLCVVHTGRLSSRLRSRYLIYTQYEHVECSNPCCSLCGEFLFVTRVLLYHDAGHGPTLRGPGGVLTGPFCVRSLVRTQAVAPIAFDRPEQRIPAHAFVTRVCLVASRVCSAVCTAVRRTCACSTAVVSARG